MQTFPVEHPRQCGTLDVFSLSVYRQKAVAFLQRLDIAVDFYIFVVVVIDVGHGQRSAGWATGNWSIDDKTPAYRSECTFFIRFHFTLIHISHFV